MRKIEFQGVLSSPQSFQQYFLILDALLPLEWRVKTYYSPSTEQFIEACSGLFDCISVCDNLTSLSPEAQQVYFKYGKRLNLFITEDVLANLRAANGYMFAGIDEILIPLDEFAKTPDEICSNLHAVHLKTPIRRIDLLIPSFEIQLPEAERQLSRWCETHGVAYHVVIEHDDPTTEWYSRPGIEEIVDPDPIPFVAGDVWCSVASDSLYYIDGFHHNLQKYPDGSPFYTGFDPVELVRSLLCSKVELYTYFATKIMDDNIYRSYFSWVAEHVTVNDDFTFIPNFMLRPDTRFYRAMLDHGWNSTKLGLLMNNKPPLPLVEIR